MQDSLEPIFKDEQKGSDNSIKTEKLLSTILAYWPVLAICIVVSMLVAYVYLRYVTPKYMAYASVLIKDDARDGGMGEGQLLQGLGLQATAPNVENEVEILKSRTLMKKVVDELQLNIHYYAPGRIKTSEYYYKDLPFRFVPLYDNGNVPHRYKYQLIINGDNGFTISDNKKSWQATWGDTISLPVGLVVLENRGNLTPPTYKLKECTIEITATEYQAVKTLRLLDVYPINKASVLQLSISDILPQRGEDILNELIAAYLKANVDDRRKKLDATDEFIDERLKGVTYELSGIEKNIEQFKSTRKLTDLSEQSKLLLNYTGEYAKQLTEKEVKLRIIESLEQYLNDDRNKDRIVPSSLLVEDDAALNAMKSYNDLQLKRSAMLLTNTEDNPFVKNLDRQLENIREDMIRSLAIMKQGIKISIQELENKAGFIDAQIKQVPEEERIYLEYSRQQNIKQELYLYLLKKREENAISKSITIANARIVDPAKSDSIPYSPQPMRIYLVAFVLGIILPGLWIFVKELFNIKVSSKEEIRSITAMDIIAEIGHSDSGDEIVVGKESKTAIAEQFRALRTNMQFLLTGEDEKVILLTSGMSGEGKSFVALNLAVTLALSGEKVALLELDLRKPKISEALGLKNGKGFTQYIIGQAVMSEIIQPSGAVHSLDIMPSGAIPPNPSELLSSKIVSELFDTLKKEYDYIVVDTAPVGLVTDAQLLSKYADTVLYVSRINYTYKEQLRNADELVRTGKMQKMNLVVNDMKAKGGVYGYGYGSYGTDYFEDGKDKSVINRLKNKLNKKA